jgi:hypothetical protein
MFSFRKFFAVTLLTVAASGAVVACGGSDSSTSSGSESLVDTSGGGTTETTMPSTGSGSIMTIEISYVSCNGSTLTITTDNAALSGAEVTRYDASDTQQRVAMTKNADGSWSGTVPSGAGYEDRITVFATGSDGKKSSRSSALPLQLEDGSFGTCA